MLPFKVPKEDNNILIDFKGNKLNISYITDKILAMASPYTLTKEKFNLFQNFFNEIFNDNIIIISLCNEEKKKYNEKLFGEKIKYILFPINDHETVSIKSIHEFIIFIDKEVKINNKYIIIHCHRGKGRTGLILSCYFLYKNVCNGSEEAIDLFNKKRCIDNSCVKNPTQRKYVKYYEEFIKEKLYNDNYKFYNEKLKLNKMTLRSINIEGIESNNKILCFIYEIESNKLIFKKEIIYGFNNIESDKIVLENDVTFYFIEINNEFSENSIEKDNLFKLSNFAFAFNPYFEYNMNNKEIKFNSKSEINKIYKSKEQKYNNIKISLNY
jgi:protein-tyrosine phosphatase